MRIPSVIAAALFLLATSFTDAGAPPAVTMASLLKELTDYSAVTRFPNPPYMLKQASSYDRRSVSPDKPGWFANGDQNQFIREEQNDGRSEFVMMDADGPGAIVRFWLTTLAKEGTMRFYFDNEEKPAVTIPAFDLARAGFKLAPTLLIPHSSYEPNGKGGNTLYLPMPYQKHCKITWEFADSANRKTPHYYQINYRQYSAGTGVETFNPAQLARYKSAIDQAASRLAAHPVTQGKSHTKNFNLAPGGQASITLPEGAAAIRELKMSLAASDDHEQEMLWRSLVLRISFDGHQTVDCPVGDFIGSGYGGRPIESWYRSLASNGSLSSRWVMPYRKTASISLINTSSFPVTGRLSATVSPYAWTDRSMHFHATYKFEKNVRDVKWDYDLNKVAKSDPAGPIDWNFATLHGKGIYLGNTLSIDNHMKTWYGEGDAKAWVDGETFPSEFGTGLEDYYNTSWAPVVLYQSPFANAPRADNPSSEGHNTFTRTRNLDGIPFNRSFSFDMEMLSWDGGTVDAAATTYWYGMPDRPDTTPTPQWRPVYHFTPAKNWTNDPNGLIYYNGQYHLYNQQNPFGNEWGHMSWGHATSKDLRTFRHHPIAIPETIDKDTNWRFSGCAVYDKNNTSGFGRNGKGPLVAIYTVAQPNRHRQSQWLAYSNDGGMSYTNYKNNPVLDLEKEDFRDPNVRWHKDLNAWVMVVAMPAEHAVRFYKSPNLKDWSLLSEFGNDKEGFHGRAWECPFLVQLPVDGNENNKKWVLFVSSWGPHEGPFMQYFIGNFDGKQFINDNPGSSYLTVDEGNTFYAAIPFNDQPQGKEILVGWMVPLRQPTWPWRGQFAIPRDLSLRTTSEGIRLFQVPTSVITSAMAAKKKQTYVVDNREIKLANASSTWIKASFTPGTAQSFGLRLNQLGDSATTILYDVASQQLSIRRLNGEEVHPLVAKIKPVDGKLELEVLLDNSSLEVFVNKGEKVFTTFVFPSREASGISVFAEGGSATVDVN